MIPHKNKGWNRREFLLSGLGGGALAVSGGFLFQNCSKTSLKAETFIGKVAKYESGIKSAILSGLRELQVAPEEIKGKKILLKPNIVETHAGAIHINTHPLVVRGATEVFLHLGAAKVVVAEGPGHCHDPLLLLEESGFADILSEDRVPFVDLNNDQFRTVPNSGKRTRLKTLTFPAILKEVDWIVSVAKLKTHHWAGVTFSMKNLFGVMPGIFYGWPKNVFHVAGIEKSILDINATLRPHFAIVDGIVGMEGDGPIMGTPRHVGVLVMGRNLPAVDATCARIIGIDPKKVRYLSDASDWLGPIREKDISQLGETIASVATRFELLEKIPAHKKLLRS